MRSQKDGASHDNIKILTPEERKAARLAKFGTATDTPVTKEITAAGDASSKKVPIKAAVDLDVLKKRADRFGEVVSNKVKTVSCPSVVRHDRELHACSRHSAV